MAKKKTELEENLTPASTILESLRKTYGDIVSTGTDLISKQTEVLKISPRIDGILNGGIPDGSTVFISGAAKGGKTSLTLKICQVAQAAGRDVWYLDVEHRLKKMNLEGCKNLDVQKFKHIHSTPGNILSAEKVLTISKQILTDIPKSVVVIDSFGALVTEGELIGELKGSQRNDLHKLLSLFHRTLAPIISINNNILIGIQHVYANVSGKGYNPWMEAGSTKGRYMSDIKLKIKGVEAWEYGDVRVGQAIKWIADYTSLGAPGKECETYLRYGLGIDILQEKIMDAIDLGLIEKKAPWFACHFINKRTGEEKPSQFNGEAKLYAAVAANEDWLRWLDEDLKELGVI